MKINPIVAGAVGGLVGGVLMGPLHVMAAKFVEQPSQNGEDATEKVAKAVTQKVTGKRLNRPQKKTGGQTVHFLFAASMGALYGLLADRYPAVRAGAGTAFGSAVYTGAHALAVPALNLAPSPAENGVSKESLEFASHLMFGAVTDGIYRILADR
jgi:putative membrane protein